MSKRVMLHDVVLKRVPKRPNSYTVVLDHNHVWEFLKALGDAFTRKSRSTEWDTRRTNYVKNVNRIISGVKNWEIRVMVPRSSKRFFRVVRAYCFERNLSLLDRVNNYDSLNLLAER